jgi:hypothetical protein
VRHARSLAKKAGQPISPAAVLDLEATLDAAFSDPDAGSLLREGRLTAAVHYSGLGFGPDVKAKSAKRRPTGARTVVKARQVLEQAHREAERADADVDRARRAVATAEAELKRLQAALSVAVRQATKAHGKTSTAQKKVDDLTHPRKR